MTEFWRQMPLSYVWYVYEQMAGPEMCSEIEGRREQMLNSMWWMLRRVLSHVNGWTEFDVVRYVDVWNDVYLTW